MDLEAAGRSTDHHANLDGVATRRPRHRHRCHRQPSASTDNSWIKGALRAPPATDRLPHTAVGPAGSQSYRTDAQTRGPTHTAGLGHPPRSTTTKAKNSAATIVGGVLSSPGTWSWAATTSSRLRVIGYALSAARSCCSARPARRWGGAVGRKTPTGRRGRLPNDQGPDAYTRAREPSA